MAQTLQYHSWNADGITEEKIKKMMPHWNDSDLIFIQESQIQARNEQNIADFVKQQYGYESIFHSSLQWKTDPTKSSYGLCVFYKDTVKVKHVPLSSSDPNLPFNHERIMMVKVGCDLLDKEILFFNLYFPSTNRLPCRADEQQKWLKTIKALCRKHADEHCIWVGDFNMQKLKPNHKPDQRSRLFDQLQKIIKKYGFRNIADKLWKPNVFTRHAPHKSNQINHITSTLDYVITSKSIQELNQTCVPLYDMDLSLSDHIDIKCSNKIATRQDLAMPFLKRVVLYPPTIARKGVNELKCDGCGYKPSGPSWIARDSLKKHVPRCTGSRETVCHDCNKDYGNRGNFELHRKRGCTKGAHGTICSDCGNDFKTFANLQVHRNRKSSCKDRNPVCLKCNKNCTTMSGLASHQRGGC